MNCTIESFFVSVNYEREIKNSSLSSDHFAPPERTLAIKGDLAQFYYHLILWPRNFRTKRTIGHYPRQKTQSPSPSLSIGDADPGKCQVGRQESLDPPVSLASPAVVVGVGRLFAAHAPANRLRKTTRIAIERFVSSHWAVPHSAPHRWYHLSAHRHWFFFPFFSVVVVSRERERKKTKTIISLPLVPFRPSYPVAFGTRVATERWTALGRLTPGPPFCNSFLLTLEKKKNILPIILFATNEWTQSQRNGGKKTAVASERRFDGRQISDGDDRRLTKKKKISHQGCGQDVNGTQRKANSPMKRNRPIQSRLPRKEAIISPNTVP